MGADQGRRTIDSLVDEQLSAVSFVRDYVEFHFDGPVLRSFTRPAVVTAVESSTFGQPGSRDVLCSLIGAWVKTVEVRDDEFIRLIFRDGRRLTIPLDAESRQESGGEAATFQGEAIHSPLDIW